MTQYGKYPGFIVRQETPFNGGPEPDRLRREYVTPVDAFYVRAHGNVPEVDPASYQLSVAGAVEKPLTLKLDSLHHDFPMQTQTATLQCAGQRRSEFNDYKSMGAGSVMWDNDAISTAVWRGVALRDVLKHAGVTLKTGHVAFVSLDQIEKRGETFGYGGSIPLEKALNEEVLLAYEMNGEPLPPVHGAPLRVIVPGYVAARSVKWLARIIVQEEPSDNFYQAQDYKVFPPEITAETVDWSTGEMLGPLQSDAVICTPEDGSAIKTGRVTIEGYAIPKENAVIEGVEVSIDGGTTWKAADLVSEPQPFTWTFWQITQFMEPGTYELVVRLTDSVGTVQPDDVSSIYNFRGYMNNALHRVQITVSE